MKKWLWIAAWNIALVIVLLAIVEFGLRFTSFDQVRMPPAGNPPGYYVADTELGIRIAPNYPRTDFSFRGPGHEVFSNGLGCFDTPVELAENEPYMLAIGDSFTWGYNPLEAKWTSILERRLGMRVLKCGVPGTGTKYQLKHMRRLLAQLPHPPQTVIHLYDTTDFNDDFIFPGEAVINGQRVENYQSVRLSDGEKVDAGPLGTSGSRGQIYVSGRNVSKSASVLVSLVSMGLTMENQIENRRELLEGDTPQFLGWRYEFNLLLVNPEKYPFVVKKLGEHLETLREFGNEAREAGARYVLFHTNSFRLPDSAPLVRRFESEFAGLAGFRGKLPELDRHLFDPHWNSDSEEKAAEFMLERLEPRSQSSGRATNRSLR